MNLKNKFLLSQLTVEDLVTIVNNGEDVLTYARKKSREYLHLRVKVGHSKHGVKIKLFLRAKSKSAVNQQEDEDAAVRLD